MALRMNSEAAVPVGAMLYAGMLPGGRTFYGSRTLMADEGSAASSFSDRLKGVGACRNGCAVSLDRVQ